jgi:serine/threonine protein kinase/tetratricopeptide (TPR) repeat protein
MSADRFLAPERWARLEQVFLEALEADSTQRQAVLDRRCGEDRELRQKVERLLAARAGAEEFLGSLAQRAGVPFPGPAPERSLEGRRVGAYRLRHEIGRGGMGAVYLAERADGEFEKRVAIKLLPLGLGIGAARRRFLAERRILARLEHPGIARLLDAGMDQDGTPFIVMEYVEGEAITRHCDRVRCSIEQRIELFLQVCDAVGYAHGKQVVHRDLKPANILITPEGTVKLLDFGIAKVLDTVPGLESTLTAWGGSPMTVAYASPEQIVGESVGFASDVFQLGILLYELLTGRPPFEPVSAGSWAELVRAIGVRRVIPPSMGVGLPEREGGGCAGPDPVERARMRRTGVAALRARLAGEMDAILFKALRRDPARRYASVAALVRDIQRYRDGRPIAAGLEMSVRPRRGERVEPVPSDPRPRAVSPPSPSSVRRDQVVVLPFKVPTGSALEYLRLGLASLFAAALDDSGVLSVVESPSVRPDQLGAGVYVLGEVEATARGVRLVASLHETGSPEVPRARASAECAVDEIVEAAETMAMQLFCAMAPAHSADLTVAAASAGPSLAVFKLFLRGEQALHAGNFFMAAESYQAAVEMDPEFAIGYYRLALAAFWAQNTSPARSFAAEAAARGDRLPPRARQLLAALERYLDGELAEAEQGYAAVLENSPYDLEAAFLCGSLLFYHNSLRGRPQVEARPYFERVLSIQPDHVLALLYLSTIVAHSGDLQALSVVTRRIVECYPDGGPPGYPVVARTQEAFAGDDLGERDAAIEELRRAGSQAAFTALHVVTGLAGGFDGIERITRLMVDEPESPPGIQATGHLVRAHLEKGRGRLGAAARELELAEGLGSAAARETRALFALCPFLPASTEELAALRETVDAWQVTELPDAPPPIPHFAPHHGVHAGIRWFLLGLLHARLGDDEAALERAASLDVAAARSTEVTLASFAQTVRAEVAWRRSGPEAALAVWEAHELRTSLGRALSSGFYTHIYARFARAELLRATARRDEALGWYATFGENTVHDLAYLAPARLRQAEILADQGHAAGAIGHYERFVTLWRDCDPRVRPLVEAARRRISTSELQRT